MPRERDAGTHLGPDDPQGAKVSVEGGLVLTGRQHGDAEAPRGELGKHVWGCRFEGHPGPEARRRTAAFQRGAHPGAARKADQRPIAQLGERDARTADAVEKRIPGSDSGNQRDIRPSGLKFFGADLRGVRLCAEDLDWSYGSGSPVFGAAQDLLLPA